MYEVLLSRCFIMIILIFNYIVFNIRHLHVVMLLHLLCIPTLVHPVQLESILVHPL